MHPAMSLDLQECDVRPVLVACQYEHSCFGICQRLRNLKPLPLRSPSDQRNLDAKLNKIAVLLRQSEVLTFPEKLGMSDVCHGILSGGEDSM